MAEHEAYDNLIAWLEREGAGYRLIEHAPEGRTELVSRMRGHPVAAAAKCLVLILKFGKKKTSFVLAVVPGDARVDMAKLKEHFGATYAGFAATEVAERLTGTVAGTVLPFAFNPELELIVDPGVLKHEEIFFNAARLDRSLALKTADYLRLARPPTAEIAEK